MSIPYVKVTANDYSYEGWLVTSFHKRSGVLRHVVEDKNGRLFIHNPTQVKVLTEEEVLKEIRENNG